MRHEVPTEEDERFSMLMKRQYMATVGLFELLSKLKIKSASPILHKMQMYRILR